MLSYIKNNKINLLIITIFLLLPFIFFRDSFNLSNVILGNEDTFRYYIPIRKLIIDLIKRGEFPFWNQYNFGGFPIMPEPATYVFYPIILILDLLLPVVVSYNLSLLLHYSLAGIFMYLFLKERDLNKFSCFTGGLIFIFSGMMISYRSFAIFFYTFIWLPLILLFIEKFRKTKKIKYVLISSIFLLFSLTGGFLQVFVYNCLVIFFYVIFYSFFNGFKKSYYFLFSLIVFVIVLLAGAVQIIPTLELMKNSFTRHDSSYTFFSIGSFNPKLFLMFFFPYIFGAKHLDPAGIPHFLTWFGKEDSLEIMRYFGISTIPLFIFGFFKNLKEKYLWLFIILFSFFMVLGKHNPLYKLVSYIPFFNSLKVPTRYWSIFGFAFSVLCAFGFDYIIKINSLNKNEKKDNLLVNSNLNSYLIFKRTSSLLIYLFIGLIVLSLIFSFIIKTSYGYLIINIFKGALNDFSKLILSFDLKNFAVYIPLIIIVVTILFLILFKILKKKIIYFLFIIFIFFDLFMYGHFDEKNMTNIFSYNQKEILQNRITYKDSGIFRIAALSEIKEQGIFMANKNAYFKQEYITGYDPLMLANYAFFFNIKDRKNYGWLENTNWLNLLANNNLLSLSNCKYIAFDININNEYNFNEFKLSGKDLFKKVISLDDYKIVYLSKNDNLYKIILENKNFFPRFYFAKKIQFVFNSENAKKIIWDNKIDKDIAIVLINYFDKEYFNNVYNISNSNFNDNFNDNDMNYKISVDTYLNNFVKLTVENYEDSFLVFADTNYSGWRAYVDGFETKIYTTNGLFKGIIVPKGKHQIVFRYIPSNFYIGVFISSISLIVFIISLFLSIKKDISIMSYQNYNNKK